MDLSQLHPGQWGQVNSVGGSGALRRRLIDMGITPGVQILVKKRAPFGDPMQVMLRGYELSIRAADARQIAIHPASQTGKPQGKGGTR